LRLGGFRRLTIVGVFRWVRDGAGDSLTVTEDRHPVLRALALELEDVLLVVANVMEQLVPNGPFVIEARAPQRLQTNLPSDGDLPFGPHWVVHLLLPDR